MNSNRNECRALQMRAAHFDHRVRHFTGLWSWCLRSCSRQLAEERSCIEDPDVGCMTLMSRTALGPDPRVLCCQQGGDASQAQTQQDQQRVYIGKQQRWLLLLRHASKCSVPPGMCSATPHCQVAKQLVHHVTQCQDNNCAYPRCVAARDLLRHHMRCQEASCVICTPVSKDTARN